MRFYDKQHAFYCGVDLHTRKMYLCVLDGEGNKRLHRNLRAKPEDLLRAIKPFRTSLNGGLVVGVECMFTWSWLADLCQDERLEFTRAKPAECCNHNRNVRAIDNPSHPQKPRPNP